VDDPERRKLPPIGRIDTATVVVAFGIQDQLIWLLCANKGDPTSILVIAVNSIFALISQLLRLFMYAIFIRIILSWIAAGNYNPAIEIIGAITEPVMRPFRRIIPPIGGFDISPIFAMLTLGVAMILIGGVQLSLLGILK
jgi:YggT family protein